VHLAEFHERKHPLVQLEAADAKRILLVLVWPATYPSSDIVMCSLSLAICLLSISGMLA
jgi:hypothetical protein